MTSTSESDAAFVFGMGFLGREVARALGRDDGAKTTRGTTRSAEVGRVKERNVRAWDGGFDADVAACVRRARVVVSCVPPVEASDGTWSDPVYDAYAETLASAHPDGTNVTRFFGYCSTTSVYGDHGGGWVNETSACAPESDKARARLDAESKWRALAARSNGALKAVSFRLGGIYGPNRSALETAMRRAGKDASESASSRARDARAFTSRVHVRDAANVIAAIARAGDEASDVYNVVDDYPVSRLSAVKFAGQILGLCPGDDRTESTRDEDSKSWTGEKRVRNDLIMRELARFGERTSLEFPSVYHGLRDIAVSEGKLPVDEAFDEWFAKNFPKLASGEYAGIRYFTCDDARDVPTGENVMEMRRNLGHDRWFFEFIRPR